MRAVGCADLHHPRSAFLQDIAQTEPIADLYKLAARHCRAFSTRQSGQRKQHCGGIVIDNKGRFTTA